MLLNHTMSYRCVKKIDWEDVWSVFRSVDQICRVYRRYAYPGGEREVVRLKTEVVSLGEFTPCTITGSIHHGL